METPAAHRALKRGLNLVAAFSNSREIATMLDIPYFKLFLGVLVSGLKNAKQLAYMANAFKAFRIATEDGDNEQGLLPVGQSTGLIHDNPTISELMERMITEAKEVQGRLNATMA